MTGRSKDISSVWRVLVVGISLCGGLGMLVVWLLGWASRCLIVRRRLSC